MMNSPVSEKASDTWRELPPVNTIRWSFRHKKSIVEAVTSDRHTIEELLDRYPDMSAAEIQDWINAYVDYGDEGLHTTKLQKAQHQSAQASNLR